VEPPISCTEKWKQTTLDGVIRPNARATTSTGSNSNSSFPMASSFGENISTLMDEREEHNIQCPTCFQYFSVQVIAEHADACVDVWIGDVDDSENDTDSDLPNPLLDAHTVDVSTEITTTTSLKTVAQKLADEHISKKDQKRLNVRRKHLWVDFKQACVRYKLDPSTPIRIVFLGEPAIDDGGPKREFFSGIYVIY
jgi:hypothetical protein